MWVFFLLIFIYPVLRQKLLDIQRLGMIRELEQKRKSRVIILIHRQETVSFLGIPIARFIDIDDSESILRAIRLTPKDMPIDMIVHTPGGLVLASEQIALALVNREGQVTIFVPHYAMSGGTLLALAGDKIIMDENAVLGSLDPQIGEYPAVSILSVVKKKPIKDIKDKTLIFADVAQKGIQQIKEAIVEVLQLNKMDLEKAKRIADELSSGKRTHDYPIRFNEAKKLGLPVETGLPEEVYKLMDLYPQTGGRRPSVQYIPTSYPLKGGRGN